MKELRDQFGRKHDYLRISLVDKCNLRCSYCMPEERMQFMPTANLMQNDELLKIAGKFVDLGVNKIRLTGGEPLIRKDFSEILYGLSKLPVELRITTNAILLDQYFDELKAAGIKEINISLDTLNQQTFREITKRDQFSTVWANIEKAIEFGFHIKLNCVVLKGVNEDEVLDFVQLTKELPIEVRFIEYMPFNGNNWEYDKVVQWKFLMDRIDQYYVVEDIGIAPHGTSRNYKIKDSKGSFGFISTITNPFCDGCNRIRLTADGKVKNCLFSTKHLDLLGAFREGKDLEPLIRKQIEKKKFSRGGLKAFDKKDARDDYEKNRSMIAIGG